MLLSTGDLIHRYGLKFFDNLPLPTPPRRRSKAEHDIRGLDIRRENPGSMNVGVAFLSILLGMFKRAVFGQKNWY